MPAEQFLDIPDIRDAAITFEADHEFSKEVRPYVLFALESQVRVYIGEHNGEFGYGDEQRMQQLRTIGVLAATIPGASDRVVTQLYAEKGGSIPRRAELSALLDPDYALALDHFSNLPAETLLEDKQAFFHRIVESARVMIRGPKDKTEAYLSFEAKWGIAQSIFRASIAHEISGDDKKALVEMYANLVGSDTEAGNTYEHDVLEVISRYGVFAPWKSVALIAGISDEQFQKFTKKDSDIHPNLHDFFANARLNPFEFGLDTQKVMESLLAQLTRLPEGTESSARSVLMTTLSLQEAYDAYNKVPGTGSRSRELQAFYSLLDAHIKSLKVPLKLEMVDFLRVVSVQAGESPRTQYGDMLAHASEELKLAVYTYIRDAAGTDIEEKTIQGFLQTFAAFDAEFLMAQDDKKDVPRWVALVDARFYQVKGQVYTFIKEHLYGEDIHGFIDLLFATGHQDWLKDAQISGDATYVQAKFAENWKADFEATETALADKLKELVAADDLSGVVDFRTQLEIISGESGANREMMQMRLKLLLMPMLLDTKVSFGMKSSLDQINDDYRVQYTFAELRKMLATIPGDYHIESMEQRFLKMAETTHKADQIVNAVNDGMLKMHKSAALALMRFSGSDTLHATPIVSIFMTALLEMALEHRITKNGTVEALKLNKTEKAFLTALSTNLRWMPLVLKTSEHGLVSTEQIKTLIAAVSEV